MTQCFSYGRQKVGWSWEKGCVSKVWPWKNVVPIFSKKMPPRTEISHYKIPWNFSHRRSSKTRFIYATNILAEYAGWFVSYLRFLPPFEHTRTVISEIKSKKSATLRMSTSPQENIWKKRTFELIALASIAWSSQKIFK